MSKSEEVARLNHHSLLLVQPNFQGDCVYAMMLPHRANSVLPRWSSSCIVLGSGSRKSFRQRVVVCSVADQLARSQRTITSRRARTCPDHLRKFAAQSPKIPSGSEAAYETN